MLTENEKKVLRLLISGLGRDYSINEIAKECALAPNGALGILNKFEKEGVLAAKKIANIRSFKINFKNDITSVVLELALMSELSKRLKYRKDDIIQMKEATKACIIFGSYITSKKAPSDLDILFVIDDHKIYKKMLAETVVPVKIHDVIQTEDDLRNNLKKKDDVVLDIIRNGIVLWGHKLIIEVVEDVYS